MFFVQRSYSTLLFRLIGRFNSLFDTLVRSNVTRCCLGVGSCCTLPGYPLLFEKGENIVCTHTPF